MLEENLRSAVEIQQTVQRSIEKAGLSNREPFESNPASMAVNIHVNLVHTAVRVASARAYAMVAKKSKRNERTTCLLEASKCYKSAKQSLKDAAASTKKLSTLLRGHEVKFADPGELKILSRVLNAIREHLKPAVSGPASQKSAAGRNTAKSPRSGSKTVAARKTKGK